MDAPRIAKVPSKRLGFGANSWLGKSTGGQWGELFLADLLDWHTP
jgi:hypothetical protein